MIAALAIMLGAWAVMALAVGAFLAVMTVFGWPVAMAFVLVDAAAISVGVQK